VSHDPNGGPKKASPRLWDAACVPASFNVVKQPRFSSGEAGGDQLAVDTRALAGEFDFLRRALRRQGVRAADAEDLAQDVFLVVCRRWAEYDPERPIRPWLTGIAYRVAYDFRRRAGRRELPFGLVDRTDERPDPLENLGTRRAYGLIEQALAELSERQRTLIVMADLEEQPPRQIAEFFAISVFTLYARLRRARRELARACRRLQLILRWRSRDGAARGIN
jgi:RNA polymerase sigma-70 factor (ECF subfamily)